MKSPCKLGSFGLESVASAVDDPSPWNCLKRSLYCDRRSGIDSWFGDLDSNASKLSRNDSNDLEMFESCVVFGSRFSDCARWRSSKESLMWSASSSSCEGFDIMVVRWNYCQPVQAFAADRFSLLTLDMRDCKVQSCNCKID